MKPTYFCINCPIDDEQATFFLLEQCIRIGELAPRENPFITRHLLSTNNNSLLPRNRKKNAKNCTFLKLKKVYPLCVKNMFVNVVCTPISFKIKRYHPQISELQICINKNKHSFDYYLKIFLNKTWRKTNKTNILLS